MMFTGHAITPSSVCKGMDETSQPGFSPEVDYEDVFGGPPRFAALMSLPHLDRIPTANLEKTTARQLSLRTSSHPVFDLPLFGDNDFSSTAYETRSKSDALDNMFDEERPMPDSFSAFTLHGVPRSKASSRSSSRRMSPVHPTVALAGQGEGDETLVATNLAPNLKCRHSTRPPAGKFFKRGSFSSASSFDESSGKLVDGSFISLRNDAFISSLPSSPPQSGSFHHMKSIIGTTGSICVGTLTRSTEVDDVFGGFPRRIYPRPLSAVPQESRITTDTTERKAVEKARLGRLSINIESRVWSSSSAAHTSEISDIKKYTISQSCSDSNSNRRDQHDKELMMDRQTDSPGLETFQTLDGKVSNIDDDHSFLSSSKLTTSSPPAVSNTELKFKTWKDLAPDLPKNHSHSSSLIVDVVPGATSPAMMTPTKDLPESFAKQQIDRSLLAQDTENLSQTSADLQSGKVDLEERELQTLFANAWRINKRMETENYNAKFPEEAMKVPDMKDQETNWEEQGKHSASQLNSSRTQQSDSVDVDKRENDINWRDWRKYGRRQRKEQLRDISLDDSLSRSQATALDRARSLAETSVSLGSAKSQDIEKLFKAEESPSDSLHSSDSQKNFNKGVSGDCASSEFLGNEQALGRFNDIDRVASFHGLMSRRSQAKALEEMQDKHGELQWQDEKHSSETLDGRVKCWAAGKEGNLRALLSNLQHVLWAECGWQRIPLVDMIEVPDVKKAYRKATLLVHPDKVQQKGASLQQKYIAERVFDILQEAWKTFNLEELF